jgi:copper(I)-binding protein
MPAAPERAARQSEIPSTISFKQRCISMRPRFFFPLAAALLLASTAFAAHAHDYKAGDISVGHPYARPTVPNQPAGGAYVSLENKGKTPDKLVGASSPVARSVEIHTMAMENNVMKMREVPGIELKPAEKTVMKPGDGYHLMLMGLKQALKAGEKFPLTLQFEKAGKVEVSVLVEDKNAKDAMTMPAEGKADMPTGQHH